MEESSSWRPSRRALLGSVGLGIGTALAGCSDFLSERTDDGAQTRIEALENEVADLRAENAVLSERVAELETERDRLQRRVETANLWGFDQETMSHLQELADRWTDSIVAIDAITEDGSWSVGTGWVYGEGVIASNAHVLVPRRLPDEHPITRYEVWDRTGNRVEGELIGYTYGEDEIFDSREDIGFLEVPTSITDGRHLEHGVSRDLSTDEPLLQIGHPYSLEFWTAAVGPFLAHREPFFASNVPGQPGVSGSPVFDLDGEVVGMTWGGQYVRRPDRQPGDVPTPGDGHVLPAFEEAINGTHSYMHRIHTAADKLT